MAYSRTQRQPIYNVPKAFDIPENKKVQRKEERNKKRKKEREKWGMAREHRDQHERYPNGQI